MVEVRMGGGAAPDSPTAVLRSPAPGRTLIAMAAATATLVATTPSNALDPFMGFDDYPTLFGWLDAYIGKTLSEGRWVNFLWQRHVGPIDRFAAFWFVLLAWCALCALMSAAVFRDDRGPWRAALFAVALAVAPPFGALIAWANTLVPVLTVLLAYAMVAAWARPTVAATAFVVFAPLGLMSYTTSPMIMALALALCGDWRGFRRGAGLVLFLGFGVALGLAIIYTANLKVHGVFGIVAAEWREPSPVENVDDLTRNVEKAAERLRGNILSIVHPGVWVGLAVFLAAPFAAYATAPRRALPVLGVLGAGMALLILNYLLSGVSIALRAWPFAWMAVAALYALTAREVRSRVAAGISLAVLALMVLAGAYYWSIFHGRLAPFQTLSIELADRAETAAPGEGPILIYGAAERHPAVDAVHNVDWARLWSLAFRMHALTGREACICRVPLGRVEPGYCEDAATEEMCRAGAPAALTLSPTSDDPAVGAGPDGMAIIRFAE